MPVDEPTKNVSAEERAEKVKRREERRAKLIDKEVERLSGEFYSSDYLAMEGDKYPSVSFLSQALARLRKRLTREFLKDLLAVADSVTEATALHRNRIRALEAEVEALKAGAAGLTAVEYDGERKFTIKTGGGGEFSFKLPMMIDRGLWCARDKYERGDVVIYNGSMWTAREDNPAHEPGKGTQWRLAVMRGKPGRPASDPQQMRNST